MKNLLLSLAAAACLSSAAVAADAEHTIVVGSSVVPHADILRAAEPALKAAGYELKIVEYTDWVVPNLALASGELDANYFQTVPFMQDFNAAKGADLTSVLGVHVEPMGIYSAAHKSLDAVPAKALVCVPNDPVNENRALDLLAAAGVVKFAATDELKTPLDLAENPKNLRFKELEAAQLPRAYSECDLSVINANYALQIELNPGKDSLFVERDNARYANIIAVREGARESAKTKALVAALRSPAVRSYIESAFEGKIQAAADLSAAADGTAASAPTAPAVGE